MNVFEGGIQFIFKTLQASVKDYNSQKLRLDLSAGLSIALLALPQSIAYAMLAGLEPKHGLYAFMVGAVLGSLFGSSRYLQTGPVNAVAILTASTMAVYIGHPNFMAVVFLLTLLVGVFQLTAALMRLGNMTQFISRSVLEGFISAAGLLIIVSQLPDLLGLSSRSSSVSILGGFRHVFMRLDEFHPEALALGLGTIVMVLVFNRISPKTSTGAPLLPSYLFAIVASIGVVLSFGLHYKGIPIVGEFAGALPVFSFPATSPGLIKALAPGALSIALIGLAGSITIGKSLALRVGDHINADREFTGQGLANVGTSLLSGMPVGGSPTRTILNYRLGSSTRLSGVFSGVFLAFTVLALGSYMQYIPEATLAGILIIVSVDMINWKHVRIALRATRSDALAMLATFAAALIYPLDKAVFIGVGLSLILFLRKAQIPRFSELIYDENAGFQELRDTQQRTIPEISLVHIEGDIFFGATDALQEQVSKIASRNELEVLILRMKRACCLDATGILGLMSLHEDLKKRGKLLLVSGATGEVERIFRKSGLDRIIGLENIYFSDETILRSTREAVLRAIEHVNQKVGKQYRVRLFFDRPDPVVTAPQQGDLRS